MSAFILQMLGIALGVMTSIAVNVLDYFAPSSRWWKRFLIWATCILAIVVLVSAIVANKDAEEEKQKTSEERRQAESERSKADEERRKADARAEVLRTDIQRLEGKLDPFLTLARKRYPGQPDDQALDRLHQEIDGLAQRTTALEERASQRDLTASQFEALVKGLAPLKGANIVISSEQGDVEARKFQLVLFRAFTQAGWNVQILVEFNTVPIEGMMLLVGTDAAPPPPRAEFLMKVLKAVGISPTERRRQGLSGDDVVLFVGKKV